LIATPRLRALAEQLTEGWPAIFLAQKRTNQALAKLRAGMSGVLPPDTSLVVFGSLARGELTKRSDADWTLLIDGQSYASHFDTALDIERRIVALKLAKPGQDGTFGGMAFSHDLVHYIGGGNDTNRNTTQRILLLLESLPVNQPEVHQRVVRQLLKRYVEEDFGWVHRKTPSNVPRFLQNDVARYWRTIAVDFAYKRRERQAKGWALRTVKLRLSRKLTYVSGLVACYSCSRVPALASTGNAEQRTLALVDHLQTFLRRPPLEILADALMEFVSERQIADAARELFGAYNDFLALLNNNAYRTALDKLQPDQADTSDLYEEARTLGHRFQGALNAIFLDRNETYLYELTRIYGVF
jgi:predicted nucleotidyltransferase